MTLPNWLIQLGSLVGLGPLALTIINLLFSGRPMLSTRPGKWARRIAANIAKLRELLRDF
jgi:hypothetical protein